jgi:hypothetical protein
MMTIRKGTRLRALTDIETTALVYYFGPGTFGAKCRIPRDTVLVVYAEPMSLAGIVVEFMCRLEDAAVERRLVSAAIRGETFAALSFQFMRSDLGKRLEVI